MLDAEVTVKSVLKALLHPCLWIVGECSEFNWDLVTGLGFLLLHSDLLLRLSLWYGFF